jgi:ABC-2 type transport system permease protein
MPRSRRLIGCAVTLAVAVALGAPLRGGPLAVLAIAGLLAGWTLGYAGLYYLVGLRARSLEALTALVPLFLPISLLSTAYVPAELLPGWVRAAAAVNPYRHVVDAVRPPCNEGRWDHVGAMARDHLGRQDLLEHGPR